MPITLLSLPSESLNVYSKWLLELGFTLEINQPILSSVIVGSKINALTDFIALVPEFF